MRETDGAEIPVEETWDFLAEPPLFVYHPASHILPPRNGHVAVRLRNTDHWVFELVALQNEPYVNGDDPRSDGYLDVVAEADWFWPPRDGLASCTWAVPVEDVWVEHPATSGYERGLTVVDQSLVSERYRVPAVYERDSGPVRRLRRASEMDSPIARRGRIRLSPDEIDFSDPDATGFSGIRYTCTDYFMKGRVREDGKYERIPHLGVCNQRDWWRLVRHHRPPRDFETVPAYRVWVL